MKKPLDLSVFVIAKNEADRIAYTLESVKELAAEIIVIDSGSTDQTQAICEKYGARFLFNQWEGYGQQKRFAESQCAHNWLLNLDADEELTPELIAEIRALFAPTPKYNLYQMRFLMLHPTQIQPGKFAPYTTYLRLYHKDHASFRNSAVHDVAVPSNPHEEIITLKNGVWHRCFRSYRHAVEKINSYSDMQAKDFVEKRRKLSNLRIIGEPFLSFFKAYFIRRYIFLGVDGFLEAIIYAFARTLRLAKIREKTTNK
jgi:glycosyltransferase involved in cell wall biosynthesis